MVLRSQSGWKICAAGLGTRYKIAPIVFEVFTGDQSCFRLFLCVWHRQHRNSYLEKVQKNTKQWGKSRFVEVLELWIFVLDYFVALAFCVPVSLDSIFLLLYKNAWQRNLNKRLSILILICSLAWFPYTAKCEFSSNFRVYVKDWLPRVVPVLRWVLIVRQILVSLWTTYI